MDFVQQFLNGLHECIARYILNNGYRKYSNEDLVVSFLQFESVASWGRTGHQAVAQIASRLINDDHTRAYLRYIFGDSTSEISTLIVEASVWADEAIESRPWTTEYHFVHTPERACGWYRFSRDCGEEGNGACLVTAVSKFAKIAIT